MAYAAALGETAPECFDTTRSAGIVAHPLFPVCYEWPLALVLRARTLGDDIAPRGVHATHDLTLHRLPRAGDRLRTTAVVTAVESRAPGAYVLTRFETVDAQGEPVSTTAYGSLYRGVACEGADSSPRTERESDAPAPIGAGSREGDAPPDWSASVPIAPDPGPRLLRVRADLEPDPHRPGGGARRGTPGHHPARHRDPRPRRVRDPGRMPAASAAPVARIACRFAAMVRLAFDHHRGGLDGRREHRWPRHPLPGARRRGAPPP